MPDSDNWVVPVDGCELPPTTEPPRIRAREWRKTIKATVNAICPYLIILVILVGLFLGYLKG